MPDRRFIEGRAVLATQTPFSPVKRGSILPTAFAGRATACRCIRSAAHFSRTALPCAVAAATVTASVGPLADSRTG